MAVELASGFISLSVKYGDAMSKLTKDVTGLERTAKKVGENAGKNLSGGISKGSRKAGDDAAKSLQERLGERVGEAVGTKVGRAIARPISKIMGTAGTEAGESFSRNFEREASKASRKSGEKSGGSFAAGLAGFLKGPALGVVGVASAGIGVAITKGVGRLTAIDDAKAKLVGLGHDADSVASIMDSAMAAVKGTAFGMDEAATAAATAVAAGIKPGQELTKYLSTIGDAAAIANTPLSEMAPIFNKVQTNGKAMTDELQQLADRGIPVFTWLQEELGVTGDQLSDMVSDGAVDAATFQKVIQDNIGGAAQKMGNSTSGALKNLNAAVSRFGAALAGPVFDKAAGVFTNLTGVIDKATTAAGPLMEKLGGAFTTFFEGSVMPLIEEVTPKVKEFFSGFEQYLPSFGDAVGNVGGVLQGALPRIIEVVKNVASTVFDILRTAIDALRPLVTRIVEVVQTVYQGLGDLLAKVAPKLKPLGEAIVKVFKAIMPAVKLVGTVLGAVLAVLAKVVVEVAKVVIPIIIDVATWILDKIGSVIGWLTGTAFPAMGKFFKGVAAVAMWLWNNGIKPAWNGIKATISAVWNGVEVYFGLWKDAFDAVGDAAMWLWENAISPAWEGIKSVFSSAWDFLKDVFEKVKGGFQTLSDFIKGVFNGVADVVKGVFNGIVEAVKAPLRQVGRMLQNIPSIHIPGTDIDINVSDWGSKLAALRDGGVVRGPGTGTSDEVLAWLSNGEGVVTAKAMRNGGATLVAALNAGWVPPASMIASMVGHLPGFAEGLNPGADYLRSQIMKMWPQITSIGGRRSEDGYGEHSSGNAIDIMIPNYSTPEGKALGDAVASFLKANKDALGLDGMIWRQTSYGYGGGWGGKPMSDRGSDTQNHMDHVHAILGKGRGAGAPAVDIPTTALSMPSGTSVSPGSGGVSSKKLQNARDRVTDLENRLATSEMALQEAESNPKTAPSTLKSKRDAVEKNKRELEQARQELADLEAQGVSDGSGSGSDSNNPYMKLFEAVKEILPDFGEMAQIGVDALRENLPPGFSDPTQWGITQIGSGLLKFFGGLVGGIPGMGPLGSILSGIGSGISGDASGAVGSFMELLPEPFGNFNLGSPGDAPTGLLPAEHGASPGVTPGPGNALSAADPAAQNSAQQPQNIDNSIHIAEGGTVGTDPKRVTQEAGLQQRMNIRPFMSGRPV